MIDLLVKIIHILDSRVWHEMNMVPLASGFAVSLKGNFQVIIIIFVSDTPFEVLPSINILAQNL